MKIPLLDTRAFQNTVWSVNDGAAGESPEVHLEPVVVGLCQKAQISSIHI